MQDDTDVQTAAFIENVMFAKNPLLPHIYIMLCLYLLSCPCLFAEHELFNDGFLATSTAYA